MAHNVSDRKREQRRAAAAGPLPGWWTNADGKPEALDTPAGCLARGAVVAGQCRRHPECTRRVNADLAFWVKAGLGDRSIHDLERGYRCGRPAGCELSFAIIYPGGVPLLACASERRPVTVAFVCLQCHEARYRYGPQELIDMLVARERGDGNTGCRAVAKLFRRRCPQCGATTWSTTIEWPKYLGPAAEAAELASRPPPD